MTTKIDASFAKGRNIEPLTLAQAKRVIEASFKVQPNLGKRSTVINLEGEAGIGKTHLLAQIAKEMDASLINFKLMTREKEDVGGYPSPYVVTLGNGVELKCFQYIPEQALAEVAALGKPAILFFDEWPRSDKAVCSVMFSAIEDGMLGSFQIPLNWHIVAASNPSEGYQGNGVDSDHAYRRRFCWLAVAFNYAEFIAHAKKSDFHPAVVAYCSQHPKECLDTDARKKGFVYANPSAWEKVSDYLNAVDQGDADFFTDVHAQVALRHFATGLLGRQVGATFVSFAQKYMSEVTPHDIINAYETKRAAVQRLVKQGRNDLISALADGVFQTLWATKPALNKHRKIDDTKVAIKAIHVSEFLDDIPTDIGHGAITNIGKPDAETSAYIELFTVELTKTPQWRSYWVKREEMLKKWKANSKK